MDAQSGAEDRKGRSRGPNECGRLRRSRQEDRGEYRVRERRSGQNVVSAEEGRMRTQGRVGQVSWREV